MTDLEFLKEFSHRFNLDDSIFIQSNNYSVDYDFLLRDTEDKEKGFIHFEFNKETGKFIGETPCFFQVLSETRLEEELQTLDYNLTLNAIDFLVDRLRNDF